MLSGTPLARHGVSGEPLGRKRVREKEGSGSPSSHGTNLLPRACHALGCDEQPRRLGRGALSTDSKGQPLREAGDLVAAGAPVGITGSWGTLGSTKRKACRAHHRLLGLGTGCEGNG